MMRKKKICIAFLGNPNNDSRITNLVNSVLADGHTATVIGFDWLTYLENKFSAISRIYKLNRGRISFLFYLSFAVILIRELLKEKADIFFAEDFYTLPFVVPIAKFKRAKIYYNSRELYAFLGGHHSRPILSKIVTAIERYFIHKVDLVLTTGEMDSEFLEKFYSINKTLVIRNIPLYQTAAAVQDFRKQFNIKNEAVILLYQGVIINGRGIPNIITAIKNLPNVYLILLGGGEMEQRYRKLSLEYGISERVIFAGTFDQRELINYTAAADIGISLIENISVSYYHALPNKLFEYIMAGLPVLSSDLPQMKNIVDKYKVGIVLENLETETIENAIKNISSDKTKYEYYKQNCRLAAAELNWQKEYERAKPILFPD